MYLRALVSTVLTWILATAVITIDTRLAHADEDFIAWLCSRSPVLCPSGPGGRGPTGPTWLPTDRDLAHAEEMINKGIGTVVDYFLAAYVFKQQKKYPEAETRYLQALELAKTNKDVQSMAIGNAELGKLYTLTGKPEAAIVRMRAAEIQFKSLRDLQRVNQINKLRTGLERQFQR